jgi:hypothetical protein
MLKTMTVEQRLRFFLLAIAGCICAGTIIELLLAKHTETAVQLAPFALCGLGLLAVAAALARPRRGTLIALRLVMGLLIAGSLLGVYEHIEHNLAFELEIRPNATASDVWLEALKGSSPLLAPGVLALAASLALAATYEHPALARRQAGGAQAQASIGESSIPQKAGYDGS